MQMAADEGENANGATFRYIDDPDVLEEFISQSSGRFSQRELKTFCDQRKPQKVNYKWANTKVYLRKGLKELVKGGTLDPWTASKARQIFKGIEKETRKNKRHEKKRKREEEMSKQTISQSGFSGQFTQNNYGPNCSIHGGGEASAGGSGNGRGRGQEQVDTQRSRGPGAKPFSRSQSWDHRSPSGQSTGGTMGVPTADFDSEAAPPKRQRRGVPHGAEDAKPQEVRNSPPIVRSRLGTAGTGTGPQAESLLTELPQNTPIDGARHVTAADGAVEGSQVSPLSAAHARRAAAAGVLEQKEKELMERCRAGVSRSERDAAARELEEAFFTYKKADKDVDAEAEAAVVNEVQKIRDRLKVAPSKGQGGSSQVAARGHSGGSRTTLVVDKGVVPENDTAAVDTNKSDSEATKAPALPAPFHSLGSRSSRRGACLEDEEEEEREGGFELALQQQLGRTSKHVKFDKQDDVINTKDDHDRTEGKDIRKATNPPFGRVPASLDENKKHALEKAENQGAAGHVSVHEKSVSELTMQKQQGKATDSEATDDTIAALQHNPYHPSFERTTAPKPKLATAMPPVRAKLNPNAPAFVPKVLLPAQVEPAKPGNSSTVPPSKLPAVKRSAFGGKEDVKFASQPGPDDKNGFMTRFASQAPPRPSSPGRPLPTPTSKEEHGPDYTQTKIDGVLSTAPAVEQLTSKVITDSHEPAVQLKRATGKEETTADVIEELQHGFNNSEDGLEKSHNSPRRSPVGRNVPANTIKEPLRAREKQASYGAPEMTSAPARPPVKFGEPHEPAAKLGDAKKSPAAADEADEAIPQLHDPERKDDQTVDQQNQKHSVVKKDINEVVTKTQKISAGLTLQHTSAEESAVGRETIQNASPKTNKVPEAAGSGSGSSSKKEVEAMKMKTMTSGELPVEQQAGSLATPTTSSGVPGTPFDPWCPVGVEQWSDDEAALVPYSDSSDAEVTPPKPLAPTPPAADDRGLDTAAHTGQAVRAELPVPFRSGGIGSCGVGREGTQASGARPTGEEPGAGKLAGDPVGLAQLLSFTSNTRGKEGRARKVFDNSLYEGNKD